MAMVEARLPRLRLELTRPHCSPLAKVCAAVCVCACDCARALPVSERAREGEEGERGQRAGVQTRQNTDNQGIERRAYGRSLLC